LDDTAIRVLGSIVHHAHVQGDFSEAEIEIADISCPIRGGERWARVRTVPRNAILGRLALSDEIYDVYALLAEIADRPKKPPGGSMPMGF
jgi:hypothetical protein